MFKIVDVYIDALMMMMTMTMTMMMMMIVKMMMVMVMVMMTMTMTIFFAALWKEHFTGAFGSKREALISPQNINRT
jgi:hypothetical protein